MSNIFITDIVGTNDYAVPTDDTELATATSGLDTILSAVANLTYDRVLAWVEDSGGPGGAEGNRTLNCLVEKFTYSTDECPSEAEVDTMIAAIEAALEADADITSVGNQQVHIFQAGAYFLWNRDATGGFLYPNVTTDDVAVGGHVSPAGKWFDDGDMVLGGNTMSGTEKLRVVGVTRAEGNVIVPSNAVIIGDTALTGSEILKVDGGDLLVEGANINIPDAQVAGGAVGVIESNSSPLLRRHGVAGTIYIGNSGNLALTGPASSVIIGEGAATSLSNTLSASVIVGHNAGQSAGTGVSGGACVLIGYQAAQNVNDVRSSVIIGSNAAQSAGSSFSSNVVIGAGAALNAASTINNCVVLGALAGQAGGGNQTVIIGGSACSNATAANWGVYIGYNVGDNLTTSYYNVAIGREALNGLTSAIGLGGENVSIGYQTMFSIGTGAGGGTAGRAIRNIAIGTNALRSMYGSFDSQEVIGIGYEALYDTNTSASSEIEGTIAIGGRAGYNAYDADHCIYLGRNSGRITSGPSTSNTTPNRLFIHSSSTPVGTGALIYGEFDSGGYVHIGGGFTVGAPKSAAPTGESVGAVYIDDGTNTDSGNPAWRYLVSTGPDVWADVVGGSGGSSPWTSAAGVIYPSTFATDDVAIGTSAMSGTERFRVFATTASAGIIGTLLQAETTAGTPGTVSALDVQYLVNGGTASLGYAQRISVGGGGGAITTMYGIEIADLSSSGSTTTAYPIYISDQTASNAYGIYQAGNDDLNVFAGDVAIGTTAMSGTEKLRVVGAARIEGKLTVTGLIDPTGLVLDEQSTIPYDPTSTTQGTLWVRDDNPNVLVFTDNGGTDNVLAYSGASSSPWTSAAGVIYPTTLTDDVAIGRTSMVGTERLVVQDSDETAATEGMVVRLSKAAASTKASWDGLSVWAIHSGDASVTSGYTGVRSLLSFNTASAQTLPAWNGFYAQPVVSNNGTVDDAYHFEAGAPSGTGDITRSYGFYVRPQGSVVATAYGLYIEALASTTNYAIYQAGTTDLSVLLGDVAIGRTSMVGTERLVVQDSDETAATEGMVVRLSKAAASTKASWDGLSVWAIHSGDASVTSGYTGVRSLLSFNTASAQTLPAWNGFYAQPVVSNNGTVDDAYHFEAGAPSGTGDITRSYGFYVRPQGSVVDTAYGLYIEALASTTNYGIYQAGSDDLNIFLGDVAIGSTAMSGAANEHLYLKDTTEAGLSTGMYIVFEKNASDVKTAWNGVYVQIDHTGASGVAGGYTPFTADLNWNAAQTLNAGYGYQSRVDVSSGGTISTYYGFQAGNVTGAGTIGTSYGLFVDDMGLSSTNAYGIYVQAQTASGTAMGLYVDDDAEITGKLTVGGLIDPTGLKCTQQATDPGGTVAGEGTIWVRNDSPTTLMFTDSGGTDYAIGGASGGSPWTSAAGVIYPSTITDKVAIGVTSLSSDENLRVLDPLETGSSTGIYSDISVTGANTKTSWTGAEARLNHSSSNSISIARGYEASFLFTSTGGATNVVGYQVNTLGASGAGTIAAFYGVNVNGIGGGSTVTDAYGLYIGSLAAATNSYGIYQVGDDEVNYFAGQVSINDDSPASNVYLLVTDDDDTNNKFGVASFLDKDGTGAAKTWTGFDAVVNHTGDVDATQYRGFVSDIEFSAGNTRTLGTVIGFESDVQIDDATDTITDYIGFLADAPQNNGTITNAYGIRINAQGGDTLSYGIYQVGGDDENVLVGHTVVGTTALSGTEALRVYNSDTTSFDGALVDIEVGAGDSVSIVNALLIGATIGNAGGITTAYRGVYIQSPSLSGTGAITNAYGLFIATQGATGDSYGIWQASAGDQNYLAGQTGIGISTFTDEKVRIYVKDTEDLDVGLDVRLNKDGATTDVVWYGVRSAVDYTAAQDQTGIALFLAETDLNTSAGQDFTTVAGFSTEFSFADNENITNVVCFNANVGTNNGTIDNWYGLIVHDPNPGDEILNSYGVYIEDMSGTDVSYGIYQVSSGDDNYFAGQTGFGEDTPSSGVQVEIAPAGQGSVFRGLLVDADVTTGGLVGANGVRVETTVTSSTSPLAYQSFSAVYEHNTNTTASSMTGYISVIDTTNAGATISDARHFYASSGTAGTGTTTNAYGFYCADLDAAGSVTNAYGVYINDQTATTLNYGLYQAGSDDLNYFAGRVGFNKASPASGRVIDLVDDSTSAISYGAYITSDFSAAKTLAVGVQVDVDYSGSATASSLTGVNVQIENNGSGSTISTAYGYRASIAAGTGETVSSARCYYASAGTLSGGTVTSAYGVYIADLDGGGSVTTAYGVYIASQTPTGNGWGIYQVGSDDRNYFSGQIGVGTTSIDTSAAIEIASTTRALLVSRMSTTQRNALTAVNGMILYNTTTNQMEGYVNGSWTAL
jgi:hypothetical protein